MRGILPSLIARVLQGTNHPNSRLRLVPLFAESVFAESKVESPVVSLSSSFLFSSLEFLFTLERDEVSAILAFCLFENPVTFFSLYAFLPDARERGILVYLGVPLR